MASISKLVFQKYHQGLKEEHSIVNHRKVEDQGPKEFEWGAELLMLTTAHLIALG